MQHHGLTSEIVTSEADFTEDSGYRAAAQLLRCGRRVTAITAVNDLAAVGALSAAADAGLRIPRDLAVTGYDDTFLAAIRQVSLTSVNPDSAGMGALAARCLLRRINTPCRDTEEHLLPRDCGMTDDDADRPEPLSAKAITALLREARSLSRRADKLSETAAAVGDSTTEQLAAEACTSVEQLVHHLMLLERQVQRGDKAASRRAP